LRETASYEPSYVKISSDIFPVKDGKKGKGKEVKAQKSHAEFIFHLFVGKPPVNGFSLNFAHREIYARRNHLCKFWCGKIKGFGKYKG